MAPGITRPLPGFSVTTLGGRDPSTPRACAPRRRHGRNARRGRGRTGRPQLLRPGTRSPRDEARNEGLEAIRTTARRTPEVSDRIDRQTGENEGGEDMEMPPK
jgi:hypothetical protein